MKAFQHLLQQEEKKLAQIGNQKALVINRIQQLLQQKETVNQLLCDYQKQRVNISLAIDWTNQRTLFDQIAPLKQQIKQQIQLVDVEHKRLDELWKKQLSRYQSIKWYIDKKQIEKIEKANKLEQKSMDDLASRKKYN